LTVIRPNTTERSCGPGDTRFSAAAYRWRLMWLLCSFQGPWRGVCVGRSTHFGHVISRRALRDPAGARSLKTQQHAGLLCGHPAGRPASSNGTARRDRHPARFGRHARPGLL
jgi:hypothetical protein